VNRLAQIVAAALGKECRTVHLDERKEVKIAFSDHSKVERFFGRRKHPLRAVSGQWQNGSGGMAHEKAVPLKT